MRTMFANETPPALVRYEVPPLLRRHVVRSAQWSVQRLLLIVGIALGLFAFAAAPSRADIATSFPDTVFADGFETGNTSAWSQTLGTGTATATSAAANPGTYGLRLSNTVGQYVLLTKQLPSSQVQSATKIRVRPSATSGIVTIAQARDAGSSGRMWEILYAPAAKAFWFYPYKETG